VASRRRPDTVIPPSGNASRTAVFRRNGASGLISDRMTAHFLLVRFRLGKLWRPALQRKFPFLPVDHQRFRAMDSIRLAIALASITIPAKALNDFRCIAISSGDTVVMSKAPSAIGVKRGSSVLSILNGSSIGHGDAVDPIMRQSTPRRRRISPITQKVKASVARNCRGRPLPRTSMRSREIAYSICEIDKPDISAISAIPNVLIRPASYPTICRIPTKCQVV
jgi:hypothetical protein